MVNTINLLMQNIKIQLVVKSFDVRVDRSIDGWII